MTVLPRAYDQVSQGRLSKIVRGAAGDRAQWASLVRFDQEQRWYRRLWCDEQYEVWLLSWLPGQRTGFHDHGSAVGAFAVAGGCLRERAAPGGCPEEFGRMLLPRTVRSFGPGYVHDVSNESGQPAVSIHAYSPPLTRMRRFEVMADGLLRVAGEDRSW